MAVAALANRIPSRLVVLGGMGHDDARGLSARRLTVLEGALALPGYRFERLEDARPEDLQTNRWSQRDGPVLLVGVVGDFPSLEQEYDRAAAAGGTCLMFALRGGSRSRFEERLFDERAITAHVCSPEELLQELVRAVRAWEQMTLGGLLLERQRFRVLHGVSRFEEQARPVSVDELVSHRGEGEEEVLVFHGPPGPELERIVLDCAASRSPLRFLPEDVPILPELLAPYFAIQEALFVEQVDRRPAREIHALVQTLGSAPPRNRAEGPRLVLTTRTSRLGALEAMLLGEGFQADNILVQALPVSGAPEEPRLAGKVEAPTPDDLQRALETLTEPVPGNVLRDLALAAAEQAGGLADVTASVLERILEQYGHLPASRQQEVLDFVADVASPHPERTLDFVTRWFEPALLEASEAEQWDLARILASVLGAPACVARACDLLWRMAEPDRSKPPHPPGPAEFALRNAGGYEKTRSPASYEAFVSWAEQRAQGPGSIPGQRLARYLRPLLGGGPNPAALRRRVIDLLHGLATRGDWKDAACALSALGAALEHPLDPLGVKDTGPRGPWVPEQEYVLASLLRLREERRDILLDFCMPAQLHRMVNQPWGAPDSLEFVLAGAFPWDDEGRRLLQERLDLAARTLLDDFATPEEALARLTWSIRGLRGAGCLPRVSEFFQAVASVSPRTLLHWGQVMMREPTHPLRDDMEALIWSLGDSEPDLACDLVDALCEGGHADLLVHLSFGPKHLEILGAERLLAMLELPLTHPERAVRVAAFKRVGNDNVLPGEVLARLLLTHRGSDIEDPAAAKVWALAVVSSRVYDACRAEDKEALAAALRAPRSLGPWCEFLLQRLAANVPSALVDLMLARIEASAEAGADHEAVPVMKMEQDPPYQQLPPEEWQRAVAALERLLEHEHSAVRAQARRWLADLVVVMPPRDRDGGFPSAG